MSEATDCTVLDAALAYAELGFAVFPLKPGQKFPATANGCKDATTDPDQIERWWSQNPNFNIGLSTDGLFVLDIDGPDNEWLTSERAYELLGVPMQFTPRGGRHYFFRGGDFRNTAGKIAPNVDTRGNGGYVLVAPSTVNGTSYRFAPDADLSCSPDALPEVPDWLGTAPAEHRQPVAETNGHANGHCGGHIDNGSRNATLTSLAGSMRRRGMTSLAILAALRETNREQCRPPLADDEVATIAASVSRYEPSAKPAEKSVVVPAWKPFPTDVLPHPLAEFARASAAAIGCDEALVSLPLLGAVAGAVGNSRRVKLKRSWSEPAVLWACTIGDSGGYKSPGLEAGSRPVFDRYREARREFKQALAKWQEAVEAWKAAGAEGPEPEEPKLLAPWIDDATIEAVGAILVENERGTMVIAEELAGWFGSHDQYRGSGKGGDAAKWLRMHGGRELRIDRRTGTPRTLYIPFASVSITGTIQPGILRKYLTAENRASGMAARLLFAWPPRRPIRWTDAEVNEEITEAVADLFAWLYSLELWTDSKGERKPSLVPLADDAKSLFREFVDAHGEEHAGQSGDLAAAFSKLIGYAARFALLFALVRRQTRETDDAIEQVDRQSMADGIELARWFSQEAIRVYRLIDAGQAEQDRADLIDWIRRQGGTVTPRDVQRKGPARCRASGEAEKSLRDLVARDLAAVAMTQPSEAGGRPTEQFTLTN